MSTVYRLSDLPLVTLVKGARSRLIVGDQVMVSFIEMEPNMTFPLHKHKSEQIMVVLEGRTKQTVGDQEFTLCKGDVVVMKSNTIHGTQVSQEGCKAIDIFVPPREDYLKLINITKHTHT
jgi:quercetin dioxygenase-like cupin family protein